MNVTGVDFINDIGGIMSQLTNDVIETSFLWKRLSVELQRFNAICFRGTFNLDDLEPPHES
jgi:hypothetical protein